MEEAIMRLKLAAAAGADVCFIEGVKTKALLESTVAALAPKPVSCLQRMSPREVVYLRDRFSSTSFPAA
jgi:2-methylisocitrate lyase-like PEP mutase family enzyme